MANPWILNLELQITKEEPRKQLLPRDILVNARIFSGEEAEQDIMNTVKRNHRAILVRRDATLGATSTALLGPMMRAYTNVTATRSS
jgi:hypothetical protein